MEIKEIGKISKYLDLVREQNKQKQKKTLLNMKVTVIRIVIDD